MASLPPNPYKGNESSVRSAEGKARQRERNGNATSSGSSGVAKGISKYPMLDWDEIEDEVEHVTDIAGKVSHTQVGTSGYMTIQISIPLAYAHAALEAHLASRQSMAYLRVYHVDQEAFFRKMAEEQGIDITEVEGYGS
jgi:hypothetical protein